jgi:inorganic pyrophosphatase
MAQTRISTDEAIEVRVIEAGDDCNLYSYDVKIEGWRLTGIYQTGQPAPFDHAVVPNTSADGASDLDVMLITHRAPFPGCAVSARPIALVEVQRGAQCEQRVLAVPVDDSAIAAVKTLEDLPEGRRQAIVTFVQTHLNGHGNSALTWGDPTRARQAIHQAKQAARLARAKTHQGGPAAPVWKPLGYRVSGARRPSDTEPHTAAEYAYQQLPFRFQKYVDDYLAQGERILFAANRPTMKSALNRKWFSAHTLQEGILFITDQQVALVTELLPPDRSHIRYGYLVHTGIPERIESVMVKPIGKQICFEVTWRAVGGVERIRWEFLAEAEAELVEAAQILQRWQPLENDRRLRRAYGPEAAEMALLDPAANDPGDIRPLADRLTEALAAELSPGERILARSLLPTWANSDKVAHVLAVTDRRVLLLPDPNNTCNLKAERYRLDQITTVEFTSSILGSWLALNRIEQGEVRRTKISFPYTATGFQVCFTCLRQQLTAVSAR